MSPSTTRRTAAVLAATLTSLALAACTTSTPPPAQSPQEVTVVAHDSFAVSEPLLARFETETGYDVKVVTNGDAGSLTNQLVLTKDSPLGDAVFGIDTTFAGRALDAGVLVPYDARGLQAEDARALTADDSGRLTPIDLGDVCVNADTAWFQDRGLPVPASLEDLVKPEYRDLLVVPNAATSSPGLAFLAATVADQGEGWTDYWAKLRDNGVLVAKDWTEAYSVQFSAGGGNGPRPLVLSYSSSPAFTVQDGTSSTQALPGTCFRQVEYAGVLAGAQNPEGAQRFVEFLLSPEVQADIPTSMYMYPAVSGTPLPQDWQRFAPLAENPHTLPAAQISAEREGWIRTWTTIVIG